MKTSASISAFALLTAVGLAMPAYSSTLSGTVRTPTGKPLGNVFVTAQDADRKLSVTVFSGADGHYRIDDLFPGTYNVRARKTGLGDGVVDSVKLGAMDATVDLRLRPEDSAHLATPGAAWLNALPASPTKALFITSCTICHDMGSPITRGPRDAAGWQKIIHQMRTQADVYSVIVAQMDDAAMAKWLAAQHFGAAPAPFNPFSKAAHIVPARLIEYEVGDVTSWAHDMAVEPRTGIAWVGDYVKDQLVSVNPRTGAQKVYQSPVRGAGIHTLDFDRDGSLWITFQLADMVARFDPRTTQWRIYGGFARGALLHTFALDTLGYVKKDADGRIYISEFGDNRVSQLDPTTGKITEYALPGASGHPYGIAVDSSGKIWYTKYSQNILGYIDPVTRQGKEWPLPRPYSGPHRMGIDNEDNLWIPLSGYGTVLRYSTKNGSYKEYKLPDADTFPYVAHYDEKSDRVWITGNGANAIYALDPKSGQFVTFRIPSYLSYGRMISIDYSTGDVWTALSSYPNKLALRNHGLLLCIHRALDLVH